MEVAGGGNVAEPRRVRDLLQGAPSAGVHRLDAELLLAALLRTERSRLLAFDELEVDPLTMAMFEAGLQRRARGEPLAYITGVKEFWSLPLTVSPAVLVPRPETELLVELCLAQLDRIECTAAGAPMRVADLGTGSGAIALALGRERPRWRIVATDESAEALQIAAINARRLGIANVELRQGSWCEALDGFFHAIVSNPPYISAGHPALAGLHHEPPCALVAGDDGYADLLAIARDARAHLAAGGALLLEHGDTQAGRMAAELAALGYRDVIAHRDLAGKDRVSTGLWPGT